MIPSYHCELDEDDGTIAFVISLILKEKRRPLLLNDSVPQ